jgi:flagellar motor switch protein FliG
MPEQEQNAATDVLQDNLIQLHSRQLGARKAAIVLIMLGQDLARDILRELTDEEVELLLKTANELKKVPPDEATEVLEEFIRFFDGRSMLVPQASTFVRSAAEEALGTERVRGMLGVDVQETGIVDEGANPESIAQVLRKEHPQTVAIALAAMPTGKASAVVSLLPEDQRAGVIRRMAEIKSITPDLLREIGDTLRRELEATSGGQAIDGQELVVSLLKTLSPEEEEAIFNALSEEDPELSEEIRKKMFVFEDFITLDGRAIQLMLKEIDGRTLVLALKTATTPLREHVLSCMSSRAATMIIEDLEALGPIAVSQIEAAQDEIVQVALRLAAEGKVSLR